MKKLSYILLLPLLLLLAGCTSGTDATTAGTNSPSAQEILGNPEYQAISFGGYRFPTRDSVPSVEELKEDMLILEAMGVKFIRTYNTQQYAHAAHILEAIEQLKAEDPDFEMYVMLGAWIDCKGAWGPNPNHDDEDYENNSAEIMAAVKMANQYPDIVKVIAVGNEAMVHWAASYFVHPGVILRWVNYLLKQREDGKLPQGLWITSSDNFASWGGGDESYHKKELNELIEAVDFISMHTYPFHDTHYNADYWKSTPYEDGLTSMEKL